MIDGRNDSQVIFYDQLIPGSTLLGYLNADHWAVAVPIARAHDTVGVAVRHPERLSARGADRSGASLRRRGSCRARQVATDAETDPPPRPRGSARSPPASSPSPRLRRPGSTPSTATSPCSAVEKLDAERKAQFDRLWGEARVGNEQRLCAQGADAQQGVAPACIDWAAFTAIAGDHSCSSSEHARQHAQDRLDPAGRRRGGAAEGRSRRRSSSRRGRTCRLFGAERPRRLPAPGRGRDAARPPHQRAAHLRHAPAARRPAVRDARRLQQRPLPAAAAEHRHDAARVRRALAQARIATSAPSASTPGST